MKETDILVCGLCGAPLVFDGNGEDEYGPHQRFICSAKCHEKGKSK